MRESCQQDVDEEFRQAISPMRVGVFISPGEGKRHLVYMKTYTVL